MRAGLALGVALTAAFALTSCASNESSSSSSSSSASSSLSGTLNGVGSSAQGSAQTAWAAKFQEANPNVTVNYDPQGSGAGVTAFVSGGADFAGSDSALKTTDLSGTFKACKSGTKGIDIPVYISPIAVVFNVSGVSSLNLDATTIAKIFSGKITTWNDSAIVALNKGVTLPSTKISPVYRSDKSGTTANFTDYLNKAAPSVWTEASNSIWPYKTGEGAQKTSGVASAVKSGNGTIGYVDDSAVASNSLKAAKIKVGSSYVAPSADGASKLVDNSPLDTTREANDIVVKLNRTTTDATEYPITLVSYLISCQTYDKTATGTLVAAYAKYVASSEGQSAAASAAGSAPLGSTLAAKVATAVATIK